MNTTNTLVERQYTEWVYPEPIHDLDVWAKDHCQICDPSFHHTLIWPERIINPKISILVAGCGTSQAAILAYTNPEASVIGIDLSPNSLSHSAKLKSKHNLKNLELRQMDLHDATTLKQKFDLIYATGVLHHLENPQKGLETLSQVLKDDGVLCLALYAKYPRIGVYMMQEALRRLSLEQTPDDIQLTRRVLGSLPSWHPVQNYLKGAIRDLSFDGGIVDTFLHKQDQAYTVPDIMALAKACDLDFKGWTDNLDYYPDGAIPENHPIYSNVKALPDEEQWAVMELLGQFCGIHSFLLSKKGKKPSKLNLKFDKTFLTEWIPVYRHLLRAAEEHKTVKITRSWHVLKLENLERDLFLAIDGIKTLDIIINSCCQNDKDKERATNFFKRMWRLGHLDFNHFVSDI